MFQKKISALLLMLVISIVAFAEKADSTKFKTGILLKVNPLTFFEIKSSAPDISIEIIPHKKISIEQSLGVINNYTSVFHKKIPSDLLGIESKTTLKYFFNTIDIKNNNSNAYLAPEFNYTYYKYNKEAEYCRYGCAYFQNINRKYYANEFSVSIKFGKLFF